MKKDSNFIVSKLHENKRVDLYIISQIKELSRTRVKNLILKKKTQIK